MKKTISYLYVILGAACWGFIGLFNRMLGEAGVSVWNRVFIRNFISLVLLTVVFALFDRQVFRIKLKHLPIFLAAGLISVLCLAITYFNCQMRCSLAVAGILLYLAPSFVVLMSALLWKAPLTKRKLLALALSFAGCALVSGIVGETIMVLGYFAYASMILGKGLAAAASIPGHIVQGIAGIAIGLALAVLLQKAKAPALSGLEL